MLGFQLLVLPDHWSSISCRHASAGERFLPKRIKRLSIREKAKAYNA